MPTKAHIHGQGLKISRHTMNTRPINWWSKLSKVHPHLARIRWKIRTDRNDESKRKFKARIIRPSKARPGYTNTNSNWGKRREWSKRNNRNGSKGSNVTTHLLLPPSPRPLFYRIADSSPPVFSLHNWRDQCHLQKPTELQANCCKVDAIWRKMMAVASRSSHSSNPIINLLRRHLFQLITCICTSKEV